MANRESTTHSKAYPLTTIQMYDLKSKVLKSKVILKSVKFDLCFLSLVFAGRNHEHCFPHHLRSHDCIRTWNDEETFLSFYSSSLANVLSTFSDTESTEPGTAIAICR